MPVSPNDIFPGLDTIQPETISLLELDITEFTRLIDSVLLTPEKWSKTCFSYNRVQFECYLSLSDFNTPDIMKHINYITTRLRKIYGDSGWSNLHMSLTRSELLETPNYDPRIIIKVDIS